MKKLDEKEIIRIFASKLGITEFDDVVLIGKDVVLKTDMLVASTDVPTSMEPWQVARKSIVSCVSDFAAKGIQPHAAMISLGIPENCTRPYIEGLAEGFAIAAKEFGIQIVGGDTNEANGLVIDCSAIGFAKAKMPTRKGAKPGDLVVVSGTFGFQSAGLAILMRRAKASGVFRKHAAESVHLPKPNLHFGLALANYFSSSIDSSDGLAMCLYELASQSGANITIEKVPIADGVEQFARENGLDANDLVFNGGEEYEVVATIPRSKINRAVSAAKRAGVDIHIVGRVQRGTGDVFVGKKLLENRGFVHFLTRQHF